MHPSLRTLLTLSLGIALAGCTTPASDDLSPGSPSDPGTSDAATTSPTSDATATASPVSDGAGPARVDLGSASDYVILAKSGISTTGTTSVVGHIGISPADATAVTGFGLVMDASNEYSTSSLVSGRIYAADYSPPSPTQMTAAIGDMQTAYDDAAGRSDPTATELGAGHIGGMTLGAGLYKWGTAVSVLDDVVLSGGANDVWIFQVDQTLLFGSGAKVVLSGGAQADNVFWQVAGQTTLGSSSGLEGNVLGYSGIVLETGATLNGRALAQTAVTLDANAITMA